MPFLENRVALVTGGSRGIGAATVRQLAAQGATVAFTYRRAADEARAVLAAIEGGGGRGLAIQADMASADEVVNAVRQTVEAFGRLDILVNNAGIYGQEPIEEVSLAALDEMLAVHVRGVFLATQAAVGHMAHGGRVISIGSCLAERTGAPGLTLYAMTKAALGGLTRGLAQDLGPRGITANLILPGSTDTDMNPADGPGAAHQIGQTPLGHFGKPEDIAATVAHLAGDSGRFITGASIAVDGGFGA